MADLTSYASAVQDWMRQNVMGQPSTGFFETRHTRTPGVVQNIGPEYHALYSGDIRPADAVQASAMEGALRDQLAKEWAGRQGFIQVNPYAATDASILKHESIHDLYAKGGLTGRENQLLPLINPEIMAKITGSPTYTKEGEAIGRSNMLAQEGVAMDLTSPQGNKPLYDEIVKILNQTGKSEQSKQLRSMLK